MPQNGAPPIFIGYIGAWIALEFPWVIGIITGLFVLIFTWRLAVDKLTPYYHQMQNRWEDM